MTTIMKLTAFAGAVITIAVSTIALAESGDEQRRFDGMTIDLNRMEVVTPNWTATLVDCSDEAVECLEAPGYFLLSMPRHCAGNFGWEAGGFRYRVIAPAAHYGLPSGSYMSMKYPYAHWWFGSPVERGVQRWARTVQTPSDRSWDGNDTVEEYQVRIVGADNRFRCG